MYAQYLHDGKKERRAEYIEHTHPHILKKKKSNSMMQLTCLVGNAHCLYLMAPEKSRTIEMMSFNVSLIFRLRSGINKVCARI